MKTGVIYIAWFPNGKGYCGQTIDFDRRKEEHQEGAKLDGSCRAFYNAIRKYGWNYIRWVIAWSDVPEDELDDHEIATIARYRFHGPGGYNLTDGGHGLRGYKWTAEARKNSSLAHLGKKDTEETRAKKRLAMMGNSWNKGKPAWNKGKKTGPLSVEHRARLSKPAWNKGKKANKPAWNKGKKTGPLSVEHRAKIGTRVRELGIKPPIWNRRGLPIPRNRGYLWVYHKKSDFFVMALI